jgi:hypothetical protein
MRLMYSYSDGFRRLKNHVSTNLGRDILIGLLVVRLSVYRARLVSTLDVP